MLRTRSLQLFLVILGATALIAGGVTVTLGATSISGIDNPPPAVDSEMRFFAAWYAMAGVLLLRAVPRLESQATLIRGVMATVFIAGCSRALSWLMVGKPPGVAIVLMCIELVLPFVVLPWYALIQRGASQVPPTPKTLE